jgi:DNA-binding winged helix-turn-helix (wHTH) protein
VYITSKKTGNSRYPIKNVYGEGFKLKTQLIIMTKPVVFEQKFISDKLGNSNPDPNQ